MKIIREGKEIELTSEEIYNAYLEQEHLFDIQYIENGIENCLDDEEYEHLKNNSEFIEQVTDTFRYHINRYDMDYDHALSKAVSDTKNNFLFSLENQKIYVAIFNYFGDLHKLAEEYSVNYDVEVVSGNTLCFTGINGQELSNLMEQTNLDYNYSYESPEDVWNIKDIVGEEKSSLDSSITKAKNKQHKTSGKEDIVLSSKEQSF